MKDFLIKNNKLIIISIIIAFILVISIVSTSLGMQSYYKLDFSTGLVIASKLNVRSGPSTNYPVVTTVNKNEIVVYIIWFVSDIKSLHLIYS